MKIFLCALVFAAACFAQQTSVSGTVLDPSGAIIPNAVVRLTPADGGAGYSTLSNETGAYLFPSVLANKYIVRVDSPGFSTGEKRFDILVGQAVVADLQLKPASTSSTVEVQGSVAEVNTTTSQVAGNIDPQQMKDVPLNGRNWMELSLLVPGVTRNSVDTVPLGTVSGGKYQLNVDGQQVTQNSAGAGFGQPQYSREAISQFQIITNRFDATLGRSSQIQVNAQTRTGTNQLHGSAYGYFRSDSMNASDPIAQRVLPFSDQQFGGTVGGHIIKDKLWFFGAYEGERQPGSIFTRPTGFDGDSYSFGTKLTTTSYLGRVDYQINAKNSLSTRFSLSTWKNPFTGIGGTDHPSRAANRTRKGYSMFATWSKVIGTGIVNEAKAGFNHFDWENQALVGSQEYRFSGITIGGPYNYPQQFNQDAQQYRDDMFWMKGRHSVKLGGEYLYNKHTGIFQQNLRGTVLSFSSLPASLKTIFPQWDNPSTWNLGMISPLANSYVQGFGNFNMDIPRNIVGFWMQDDWKLSSKLTLNLGLRYDNDIGVWDGGLNLKSGIVKARSGDNNNISPRLGFAYDLLGDRKTVIRGGVGVYYADIQANQVIDQQIFNGERSLQVSVDRKPGANIDLKNPFGGVSADDYLSGKVPVAQQAVQILGPGAITPYSFQSSIGVEKQLGESWMVAADFVHWRVYKEWLRIDANLAYDPKTGFNVDPTKVARPDPRFTTILQFITPDSAGAIYDGLQMEVRKRLAKSLSLGGSYTLSRLKDSSQGPFYYANNPFDSSAEWAPSVDDQRHTLNINGSYNWKWGLQLSSFYHFGSGNAYQVTAAGSPFGGTTTNRTFAVGRITYNDPTKNRPAPFAPGYMIADRDQFYGRAIHRVDSRITKTFTIKEQYKLQGIFEAFNLFNHANYGSYATVITSANYGAPAQNLNLAFAARMLQFAARFEF